MKSYLHHLHLHHHLHHLLHHPRRVTDLYLLGQRVGLCIWVACVAWVSVESQMALMGLVALVALVGLMVAVSLVLVWDLLHILCNCVSHLTGE